jgi:hypothetical protein
MFCCAVKSRFGPQAYLMSVVSYNGHHHVKYAHRRLGNIGPIKSAYPPKADLDPTRHKSHMCQRTKPLAR